jgi:hypothetical protein
MGKTIEGLGDHEERPSATGSMPAGPGSLRLVETEFELQLAEYDAIEREGAIEV